MNFKVIVSDNFRKQAKRLKKKFPSLKNELLNLESELSVNPWMGVHIGKNCYKIRLAVKSKGKGRSGGLRVITWIIYDLIKNNNKSTISLLDLYDKSEYDAITDKRLKFLVGEVKKELNI